MLMYVPIGADVSRASVPFNLARLAVEEAVEMLTVRGGAHAVACFAAFPGVGAGPGLGAEAAGAAHLVGGALGWNAPAGEVLVSSASTVTGFGGGTADTSERNCDERCDAAATGGGHRQATGDSVERRSVDGASSDSCHQRTRPSSQREEAARCSQVGDLPRFNGRGGLPVERWLFRSRAQGWRAQMELKQNVSLI